MNAPEPQTLWSNGFDASCSMAHITKDKLDPKIFEYYEARIAHLEKLVGQLIFPYNPHI